MTQDEKLQSLEAWLTKNKIQFVKPEEGEIENDVRIIIKKPQRIVVFVCTPDQEDFNYQVAALAKHKAFFIRETDTGDFVIEKMKNALRGWSIAKVKEQKDKAAKRKRNRIRIVKPAYEKVEPKRHNNAE